MAMQKAKDLVSGNPVVVFSKSFCPYCVRVKELLQQLGAKFVAVELDKESDGSQVQSALAEWTGQRTVPNVFIGDKHIGGCDDVTKLHKDGKLAPMLTAAGAIAATTGATSA
ncbi:Glutaredoxin-C2 [Hirschfeldia incana]|nr:Glutaredoxin-C2 [Hirschfeldia incana]